MSAVAKMATAYQAWRGCGQGALQEGTSLEADIRIAQRRRVLARRAFGGRARGGGSRPGALRRVRLAEARTGERLAAAATAGEPPRPRSARAALRDRLLACCSRARDSSRRLRS